MKLMHFLNEREGANKKTECEWANFHQTQQYFSAHNFLMAHFFYFFFFFLFQSQSMKLWVLASVFLFSIKIIKPYFTAMMLSREVLMYLISTYGF